MSAPSRDIIAMADSHKATLNGIALELREAIYTSVFREVKVYQIKTRFTKNKQLHPFYDQWLVPVGEAGMTRVCRNISRELTSRIVHEAITSKHSKLIADVQDLDFRPLQTFMKSLTEAQKQSLTASSQPKIIALLHFSNTKALDAKRLGEWLKYQKQVNMTVTYHVGALGDGTSCADLVAETRKSCAHFDGSREMGKIYVAIAKHERDPKMSARQLERWYGVQRMDAVKAYAVEAKNEELVDEDDKMDDGEMEDGEMNDDEESLDSDMMSSDDEDMEDE
ncbi:hypothetical protein AC578_2448 [Pseudocercospora eumusae]|uniref:Uncharacterized protein n=1 Tax=Pseudocercospora eumusae TaxID=321146 RepID=A0A139HXI7_9PEZI|nr:hypothetical protein AC578_2448 [Pseudocercospora eumusae]